MTAPNELDATRLAALTRAGRLSALEVAQSFLDRIASRDSSVQAWAWMNPDEAIARAKEIDRLPRRGLLHGVPIGVKDVFLTKDMPTAHGSLIYAGHRPGVDAASVGLLRSAGALILGKTTTVEFAGLGRKPPTRHPLDPSRSPGGSSSGSAAAVADRQVPLALGTQTAGSTMRPASFCGVHAFKPTWGSVSGEGVKLLAVSLDTVTWFGRSIPDLQLICDVFEISDIVPWKPKTIGAMVIGVCRTPFWSAARPDVQAGIEHAACVLAGVGATVVDVELPVHFADLRTAHLNLLLAEGRIAMLNEYHAHPDLLHSDCTRMISGDRRVGIRERLAAQNLGAACRVEFDRLAGQYDAVLTPSAADVAPLDIENAADVSFNQIWSLLHTPCVNLPVLHNGVGLPIGLTLTGPRYMDRALLDRARAVEAALCPMSA